MYPNKYTQESVLFKVNLLVDYIIMQILLQFFKRFIVSQSSLTTFSFLDQAKVRAESQKEPLLVFQSWANWRKRIEHEEAGEETEVQDEDLLLLTSRNDLLAQV